MRNPHGKVLWSLILSAAAVSLAAQQPQFSLIPSEGVIDGKTAISFLVTETLGGDPTPIDPAGFRVLLTPTQAPGRELVYPCGEWLAPPTGRYGVLIEGPGKMTPNPILISYRGSAFKGRGMVAIEFVAPAGTVVLAESVEPGPGSSVRLLHLESQLLHPGYIQHELTRRASLAAARSGVMMPEGAVFMGLYDNARQEYVALARPVEVPAGGTVEVEPRPPALGSSDLMVVLERPEIINKPSMDDVKAIWIADESEPIEPHLLVPAASRLYAIWYGLRGRGRLEVRSASAALEPQTVELKPGKVHRSVVLLQPKR